MKRYGFFAVAIIVSTGFGFANAAERDVHAGHGSAMPASAPVTASAPAPASGKAREAGFDGMEMMESTGMAVSLAVQCAQAARGIIMLDRATLAQCGTAPVIPAPVSAPQHQH